MNQFGNRFKVEIFGESHGKSLGVILDGVPAGLSLSSDDFTEAINRRRPSKASGTPRVEADEPLIMSGVFNGYTTGAPILIMFKNENTISKDYSNLVNQPRPSHADLVAKIKYNGYNDYRGGGCFSGRVTLGIVAAGVVAKKIFSPAIETKIVSILGSTDTSEFPKLIKAAKEEGNSVGGIVEIRIKNLPVGLGEPYFDSVESVLSYGLFSIPGVKGVSFGSGFAGTKLSGKDFNDLIVDSLGNTKTNHNGGINGGITNGNEVLISVAVKPTPSISLPQETFNFSENKCTSLEIKGRHDAAIITRIPVILESICLIGLADLYLRNK